MVRIGNLVRYFFSPALVCTLVLMALAPPKSRVSSPLVAGLLVSDAVSFEAVVSH